MPVIDTCILSSLAKIDKLYLLIKIFKNCWVTPSVLNELDENRIAGFRFIERIYELLEEDKIQQIPINKEGLKDAHKLREEYRLSLADCESIIACKEQRDILLTDFIGTCIIKQAIKSSEELQEIISLLKERDYYEFSESDKRYLLSLFEKEVE